MGKYIKLFNSHSDYEDFTESEDFILPNVSRCELSKDTHYTLAPKELFNYLTFKALEDGTFKMAGNAVSYSIDNGQTWTSLASATNTPTISAGSEIMWKASGLTPVGYNGIGRFSSTGNFEVYGNIMSLVKGDNFDSSKVVVSYLFSMLFENCTKLITAENLILPATILAKDCYYEMFSGCTSLIKAPNILPAITLANGCYQYMFQGCTSLTTAPELPAMTLASSCYYYMFQGCTSLITAPDLPAITLATICYNLMFSGCSSLNYVKAMFITTPGESYTNGWLGGVSTSGTFVKNSEATWNEVGSSAIPAGWTLKELSNYDLTEFVPTEFFIPKGYLTFTSLLENLLLGFILKSTKLKIYLSKNGTNWMIFHLNDRFKLNNGEYYYVCGVLSGDNSSSDYTLFAILGRISITGNCNALWDYSNLNSNLKKYCGINLFKNCKGLTTVPTLPATALADYCYAKMFMDCTSLTTAPELPATTLATNCYLSIFENCTSLTIAPTLPATTLVSYCYQRMFYGCTSLTTAPELPVTTLLIHCYRQMFSKCTSLTTAPQLPSTTLADSCYTSMFQGCTSLTTAPTLPATKLAGSCYYSMFEGCTSLVTAPNILPATTLANYCYNRMFYGCTSLTTAPELPATTLANYCYEYMFKDCTSLTAAPELPATTLKTYCYSYMFENCINLTTTPELLAPTLVTSCYSYMFNNCSKVNYMKADYQSNPDNASGFLTNTAQLGTFIKSPNLSTLYVRNSSAVHSTHTPPTWTIVSSFTVNTIDENGVFTTTPAFWTYPVRINNTLHVILNNIEFVGTVTNSSETYIYTGTSNDKTLNIKLVPSYGLSRTITSYSAQYTIQNMTLNANDVVNCSYYYDA